MKGFLKINALLAAAALISGCGSHPQSVQSDSSYRFLHNNDGTDLLGNLWCGKRPLTVEDLDRNIDLVCQSPVTTFLMCSGGDSFYYESEFGRIMGDDLGGTITPGEDTSQFRATHNYYLNYMRLKAQGVDFIGHCLERARLNGKETFITYRMNDLHTSSTEACLLARPDVFEQHPEWLIDDGNVQGWHSAGGLNFEIDTVRRRKVAIMKEQLVRYSSLIDGYELDFLRFPVFFKPGRGSENTALMTDMVKQVRTVVDSVSKAEGRDILLTVRIPSSVSDNLKLGLDIKEWLRLGLVDFITMGTYWRGDPSMPVARFREELGADLNVPLYACVDDGGYDKREPWSQGQFRGMCSNILAQGADGVYLFNFYFGPWFSAGNPDSLLEDGGLVLRAPSPELLQEIGTSDKLEGRNKTYLLSDGKIEYGLKYATPLPLYMVGDEPASIEIMVGDHFEVNTPEKAILFVRAGSEGELKVEFNGTALTSEDASCPDLFDKNRHLEQGGRVHAYIVDPAVLVHGWNHITLSSGEETVIRRVELTLNYGDVKEFGYF